MFFGLIYIIIEASANQTLFFNFPMQKGQPNVIYLEQYTPEEYQAPFYQLNSNQENLSIIQSVQQIYSNQLTISINNIVCTSNYIMESGSTSNVFWLLQNPLALYSGVIDQFGGVKMEKVNVQISASSCFNINLINYNYGILTCLISGKLSFVTVNTSSSSVQSCQSSYTSAFNKSYTFISIGQNNNYTITVACISQTNLQVLTYSLSANQLSQINSQSIEGYYFQIWATKDLENLFLLSANLVLNIYLPENKTIIVLYFSNNSVQQMALVELPNNNYKLALLKYQEVQVYFVNINHLVYGLNSSIILIQPTNSSLFEMNMNNIFIIANNFIVVLDIQNGTLQKKITPTIRNYLNINLQISSSIINQDRFLAVIFSTNSANQQLSTYFFKQTINSYNYNLAKLINRIKCILTKYFCDFLNYTTAIILFYFEYSPS